MVFILSTNFLHSQEIITWDIKRNTISSPLPSDIPFQLKISRTDLLPFCKQPYKLTIWDRGNEKDIEDELEPKENSLYPIDFGQKYKHPLSRRYETTVFTYDSFEYFVDVPWLLKQNSIYSFGLVCETDLKMEDMELVEDSLKSPLFVNEITQFYVKNIRLLSSNSKKRNQFRKDFLTKHLPDLINVKLQKLNKDYILKKGEMTFAGSNTLGSTIINNTKVKGKLAEKYYDYYISYYDTTKKANNTIDSFLFQQIIVNFQNELYNNFNEILKKELIKINNLATFSQSLTERVGKHITSQIGLGYSDIFRPNNLQASFTTIGINYFFYPRNEKVPIKFFKKDNFLKRLSLNASTTLFDISQNFLDNKNTFGVFSNQAGSLGLGFLANDGILLNIGALFYKKASINPLIDNKSLDYGWKISLDIDRAIYSLFNKFSK